MKTLYFNRIGAAQMAALTITLPFQMLPVAGGSTQPQDIEVQDIARLCVRVLGVGETGNGKPIGTEGTNRYELNGSAITLHLAPVDARGEVRVIISGSYGQVRLRATIVAVVGGGTDTTVTLSPYVFDVASAGGGGGADYKTDVYMDGNGRVVLERLDDGSTLVSDEHENPILKRNADGSTDYYDAYQSVRMSIDANGGVTFNGDVSGAGMEQYILTLSGGKFHHGDEELNFAQIKAAVEDVNKFVYLDFANAFHLPSFIVDAEGNSAVAFVSSFIISGETHIERVIINEQEQIATDNAQVLRINEDGGVAFGDDCEAYSNASFAHGASCLAESDYSHAEGYNTTASSDASHAEGYETKAIGEGSHAEGYNTTASGENSHAEGSDTTASQTFSHAEGNGTVASGESSHAEGNGTIASGEGSHAEGSGTVASGGASHAQGMYNDPDDANAVGAFSHGCGTTDSNRKNAFLIIGSEIYVIGLGGYDGTNHESAQSLRQIIQALQVKTNNL